MNDPSVTAAVSPPESLLRYCAVWNTNGRNCQDAQVVLQVLLTHVPPEELLQYQGARAHLEGLIPYTGERGSGGYRNQPPTTTTTSFKNKQIETSGKRAGPISLTLFVSERSEWKACDTWQVDQ